MMPSHAKGPEWRELAVAVLAMGAVVLASNILVQYPVAGTLGPIVLADLLTYGAFTYPIAFFVTDMTNRAFGPKRARQVVFVGFVFAVILSVVFASPRIAIASGTAFLVAQLLDVRVFNQLRGGLWWTAPAVSSVIGSVVDTALFFSLAFAATFSALGPNDAFAVEAAPLLGLFAIETPRWVSWALGDLAVKLLVAAVMLLPYGLMRRAVPDRYSAAA